MSEAAKFLDTLAALTVQIAATADGRDRDRVYARDFIDQLRAIGFWRLNVPAAYGGLGLDHEVLIQAMALLAKADGSLGQIPQNHFNTVERLHLAGSEAQRDHYLSRIGTGHFFGNATAEPGERYPGEATTTLSRRGDGWVLNGRKVYSTGALLADHISVQCRDEQGRTHSALVEPGASGLRIIDDWDGLGQRTTASGSSSFSDTPVASVGVVPHPRDPHVAYRISAQSQLLHAAIDVGLAEGALERAVDLARQAHGGRGSGAGPFVEDALGVAQLGELVLLSGSARRLTESAARRLAALSDETALERVIDVFYEVAQAKVLSTRTVLDVTRALFDVGGASSARQGSGLDRYWRDARTHTLHDAVRWKPHAIGLWAISRTVADPWSIGHPYRTFDELLVAHRESRA
jgi:alkylation response protein AidB-like acyl-CoA dehydrogenase